VFLSATFLLAFVLRLVVVILAIPDVAAPSLDHNAFGWEMGWTARSIVEGHGFSSPFLTPSGPTALVPPIFPYILAGIFRVFGLYSPAAAFAMLSFNSLCSALTCIPLYFLVRNSLNDRVARIATLAWAIYPFAIYFSAARVWDYSLTALLLACCMLAAQRLHRKGYLAWAGIGLLGGLTALSNPSTVSVTPLLLLIAVVKLRSIGGAWLGKGLIAVLAFAAICAPWTVRNHRVMHSNFFLRDGFWIEFYAGNNGDTFESNSPWAHPASNPVEMKEYKAVGEIAYIAEKRRLAIDFIVTHPVFFLEASVHRFVRFWTGYWSFSPDYLKAEPLDLPNIPFCVFLVFFMLRGIRRWWAHDHAGLLPYLFAVVLFPLPYYLTHSSMDYRQPLEPVVIVLVTVGLFGTGATRLFRARAVETDREREVAVV